MAIDSEDKRRSAGFWLLCIPPIADGTIAAPDTQHVGWEYRGITLDVGSITFEDIDRDDDELDLVRVVLGSPL